MDGTEVWIHGWDVCRGWTKACMGWPQLRCCQVNALFFPYASPSAKAEGSADFPYHPWDWYIYFPTFFLDFDAKCTGTVNIYQFHGWYGCIWNVYRYCLRCLTMLSTTFYQNNPLQQK